MLAALSPRIWLPNLGVRVLRSPDLDVIGVGEGSTPDFPRHLHSYLGIDPGDFLRRVRASWKLGIRFGRGSRLDHFNYGFHPAFADRIRHPEVPTGAGLRFMIGEPLPCLSVPVLLVGRLGTPGMPDEAICRHEVAHMVESMPSNLVWVPMVHF